MLKREAFLQPVHRVDRLAVEQAEVAGAARDIAAREEVEQPVEGLSIEFSERSVGLAVDAVAVDDLVAVAPLRQELERHLGRMLQVRVHDDGSVAARVFQPGRDRQFLAEIAAEGDRGDPRLALMLHWRSLSSVASVEPSSTNRISQRSGTRASTLVTRSISASRLPASFSTGMMIEISFWPMLLRL